MNIAIIPARGGSKRIPQKNIKPFLNKPILVYSIEAACSSQLFDEVMISTDDEEIAQVARSCGASVPFYRSSANSGDYAGTAEVLIEVLERYWRDGKEYANVCCIYPTAPFVTGQKLQDAYRLFCDSKADALVPVIAFSYPPLRGLVIHENRAQMKWPENYSARSQDLETIYHDCGQFYFLRTEALLREKRLFCQDTVPMFLPEMEVQDIDNESDWELAEFKYEFLKKQGRL